jgi:hypothetical protein
MHCTHRKNIVHEGRQLLVDMCGVNIQCPHCSTNDWDASFRNNKFANLKCRECHKTCAYLNDDWLQVKQVAGTGSYQHVDGPTHVLLKKKAKEAGISLEEQIMLAATDEKRSGLP